MAKLKKLPAPPKPLKRTHPVPLTHYHEAVQQHFGWAPSDYELIENWPDGPALVKHGDNVYSIDNAHDINELARLMLTSKDEAMHIPIEWANELFEDAYMRPEFHARFLQHMDLPREKAAVELQTVLAVYQTVKDGPASFWETVEEIDDIGLYPAALVAAAEVFNLEALIGELAEFLYTEGDSFLTEMQGGIFETVCINEEDETDNSIFYIYDKDPVSWEVAKENR